MRREQGNKRRGLTLLEMIVATTLLTTMATAAALVLRTAHTAWSAHEEDASKLESAHATLRHLVRHIRQATAVSSISGPTDNSGSLEIIMPSGSTYVWSHDAVGDTVHFGVGSATDLLAEGITELQFVAYQSDAVTQTTVVNEAQSIVCRVSVDLPHDVGGTRSVGCWAWIRSW